MRDAARIEGSKLFAKELMDEAGVPTAVAPGGRSRCARRIEAIAAAKFPCVMKADGLAAGKGVIICRDEADAREATESSSARSASARPTW